MLRKLEQGVSGESEFIRETQSYSVFYGQAPPLVYLDRNDADVELCSDTSCGLS